MDCQYYHSEYTFFFPTPNIFTAPYLRRLLALSQNVEMRREVQPKRKGNNNGTPAINGALRKYIPSSSFPTSAVDGFPKEFLRERAKEQRTSLRIPNHMRNYA